MNFIERVKGILLRPKEEWQTIAGETTTIADLYKSYVILLAAIGPIASVIGMSIVGISMPFVGSFRMPVTTSIASAAVHYVLTLAGVYILALIIDALAPTFAGEKNLTQAFKVAVYSYTPGWVVGIFSIIPLLSVLGILGLYGLYLLYLGLPVLMKSPQEKSLGYTIAVVVAAIVIFVMIGIVSRAFITYPMPGIPMRG
ncbi:MAG: YIP1 family protein [Nitrospirae bacterium]|nr:YIP1 family protein [Nitrospirota bacterium]MCL5421479.1 YIP1 family protein [Nitrospirota bacterium]